MGRDRKQQPLTRRRFLRDGTRLGSGLVLSPFVLNLAACGDDGDGSAPGADAGRAGTDASTAGAGIRGDDVLFGLYPSSEIADPAAAFRAGLASMDFSWLGRGDSVLLKVALNSENPHPATTSPNAVLGMVAELFERGAGRVVVADQSGVESVRLTATDTAGSTRDNARGAGLLDAIEASGAEAHFFEESGDFGGGYFEATLPEGHHWPRGMYLPNIVREVDHIVYLPRIGAHVLAGLTLAHKSAIGWLRDDSRHDVHNDAEQFYAKYVEISHAREIAERYRMTATLAEKVLLHGGPDRGTAYEADPRIVIASQSMASHDALAASILVHLNATVTTSGIGQTYNAVTASRANRFFADSRPAGLPWLSASPKTDYVAHRFDQSVMEDAALARAWELGSRPERISVRIASAAPAAELETTLGSHGAGLYALAPL